jgi:hypothetical protein
MLYVFTNSYAYKHTHTYTHTLTKTHLHIHPHPYWVNIGDIDELMKRCDEIESKCKSKADIPQSEIWARDVSGIKPYTMLCIKPYTMYLTLYYAIQSSIKTNPIMKNLI